MKSSITLLFLYLISSTTVFAQNDDLKGEYASNIITFAIVAYDVEETLEFYTEVLNMKVVSEFSINEEFGKRSGLSDGVPFDVTVLQLNNDPNSSQIKITGFNNKEDLTKDEFIQDRIGVQYLTILVKNVDPFIDRLNERGIEFRGQTPTELNDGKRFVLIQDPNGLFIELIGD